MALEEDWDNLVPGNMEPLGVTTASSEADEDFDSLIPSEMSNTFNYNSQDESTTGFTGAVGSSVDRMQAGAYQLIGDKENAERNLQEAAQYKPTVESYRDIGSAGDALNYAVEVLGGAVPYLAGAPIAMAGAIPAAGAALGYGLLEAGSTYAEQKEKSIPRAALSGTVSAVVERLPFGNAAASVIKGSPLLKRFIGEGVEEVIQSGAQHLSSQYIGQNADFKTAMQGMGDAIIGGAITRGTINAGKAVVKPSEGARTPFHEDADIKRVNDEADNQSLVSTLIQDAGNLDKQHEEIGKVWKGREFENTSEAAQKLQDRGAELSPVALDINTSRKNEFGEIETVNLAKTYGIGTAGDKLGRMMSSNFSMPLLGKLTDPAEGYQKTKQAYAGLKKDFDIQLGDVVKSLNVSPTERRDISRAVQHYVSGRTPEVGKAATVALAQTGNMTILDQVQQVKRMRQMTENMKPSSSNTGLVGGGIGLGIEAMATGGVPVFSAAIGTIGQVVAGGLNKVQKTKMEAILDNKKLPMEERIQKLLAALEGSGLERTGMQTDISEEVEESIKPDMGMMDMVK